MELSFFWLLFCSYALALNIIPDGLGHGLSSELSSHSHIRKSKGCEGLSYKNNNYTLCEFSAHFDFNQSASPDYSSKISLHLKDDQDVVLGTFKNLKNYLERISPKTELVFAMNAGMYDKARQPIGLYIENSVLLKSINRRDGPGNFHLKPNGVFYLSEKKEDRDTLVANVTDTEAYVNAGIDPVYATQSGPMLVIEGALHPRFLKNSTSRKRRNGVGVSHDGNRVYFVVSNQPVTFHEFGSLFKDYLLARNAVFLDGKISKMFSTDLDRHDLGGAMGPMIAVTRKLQKP